MNETIRSTHRRPLLAWSLAAAGLVAVWAAPASAQDKVILAGYGGSIEKLMTDTVIPAFEEATGIEVTYVVGTAMGNYSKVLAAKNAPEIDVYWSNGLTHAAGKQLGLYDALDPEIVTNLDQVFNAARDPDDIGVSSYVLATGIEYNTDAFEEAGIPAPTSWNDLWRPELKGKVALYNFNVAYSQDLIVILSRLNGGSEEDVQPGLDKLKALVADGNVSSFVATPAELDNIMAQGQAWVTVNGSTRAYIMKDSGAPIDFVFPDEGAGFFNNYFDVVKGAPNPEAAQILVNYLIGEEAQALISEGLIVAPVNRNVAVSPELAERVPDGDAELEKLIVIDRQAMNANLDDWADRWNREVEAQ